MMHCLYYKGDSMERYPERCFNIIAPGQPKFDFNTSSIYLLFMKQVIKTLFSTKNK